MSQMNHIRLCCRVNVFTYCFYMAFSSRVLHRLIYYTRGWYSFSVSMTTTQAHSTPPGERMCSLYVWDPPMISTSTLLSSPWLIPNTNVRDGKDTLAGFWCGQGYVYILPLLRTHRTHHYRPTIHYTALRPATASTNKWDGHYLFLAVA